MTRLDNWDRFQVQCVFTFYTVQDDDDDDFHFSPIQESKYKLH